LAQLIKDFLSPEIINEMTAVGGILILGIGFGLLEIKKIICYTLIYKFGVTSCGLRV
ncbi:unnamed protein product, partial [marine sediment metagenome]